MTADWQYCFLVKGLAAPINGLIFENMLIKGVESTDEARVYFKVPISTSQEQVRTIDKLRIELNNLSKFYGLVTDHSFESMNVVMSCEITKEKPFGCYPLLAEFLGSHTSYNEKNREQNIPKVIETLAKYNQIREIFFPKEKFYLRNAIDYYSRATKDRQPEEKLLDLMIALESLFSREKVELGFRYSLRASSLLSVGQLDKRSEIFKNIRDMYDIRSTVVHGTKQDSLKNTDISFLQSNVRESIKRLIHMDMTKEAILNLLDESIYDNAKAAELSLKVTEAIQKWQ